MTDESPGDHWDSVIEPDVDIASHDRSADAVVRDSQWREFEQLSTLYRFYLDLIVKTFFAYVVIVGTITTLVLANTKEESAIDWALVPMVVLTALIAAGAFHSLRLIGELHSRVDALADELRIGVAPHVEILTSATRGLGILTALSCPLLVAFLVALRVS